MRWLVLLVIGGAAGCGATTPPPVPAATPAPPATVTGPPVTAEEAEAFADDLLDAADAGDVAALDAKLGLLGILDRSIADLPMPADFKAGVRKGAATAASRTHLATRLLENNGRLSVRRCRVADGRATVLVRRLDDTGSLNYLLFTLARLPAGVGVEDIYPFIAGEPISQTLRRMLLRAAAEADRGLLARLSGQDQAYIKAMASFQTMQANVKAGRPAVALAEFDALPASVRSDKAFLLIGLEAAGAVGDEPYLRVMEEYRAAHPADAAGDLIAVDYLFLKKRTPELLAVLDRLDAVVGGDPYLDVLRATALSQAGRHPEARAAAERAVAAEPHALEGYNARLAVALAERDFAGWAAWFRKAVEAGAVAPDVNFTAGQDDFAALRRSPAFAELEKWLADRAKPEPDDDD